MNHPSLFSVGLIDISRCEILESHRDSITQPRVARNELPWARRFDPPVYPDGVASTCRDYRLNPVGVEAHFALFSQGSSFLATLVWKIPSLRDGSQVVRSAQGRGGPSLLCGVLPLSDRNHKLRVCN